MLPRAQKLDAIWQRYDVVVNENTARLAPLALAELQSRLVRLEQLLLAGRAYQSTFDTLAEATNTLLNQLGDSESARPATVLNAPSAVRTIPAQKLQEFVKQWNAQSDVGQWKEVSFSRDVVSAGMIQWLLARKAALGSLTQLDNLVKMIDKAPLTLSPAKKSAESAESAGADHPEPSPPELVEVQLLRMLHKYVDREAVLSSQPVENAILAQLLWPNRPRRRLMSAYTTGCGPALIWRISSEDWRTIASWWAHRGRSTPRKVHLCATGRRAKRAVPARRERRCGADPSLSRVEMPLGRNYPIWPSG